MYDKIVTVLTFYSLTIVIIKIVKLCIRPFDQSQLPFGHAHCYYEVAATQCSAACSLPDFSFRHKPLS